MSTIHAIFTSETPVQLVAAISEPNFTRQKYSSLYAIESIWKYMITKTGATTVAGMLELIGI